MVTDHTVNAVLVPGGNYTTVIDHDDLGRTTKTTSPQGVVKTTTVDALGEATIVKNITNTTIATGSYDALGNTVVATDALGRQTRTAFDTAGRATSTGAYASSAATTAVTSTSATYDPNGNITAVVDGNGNTTTDVG